mgnify:CR=1 FL=1
MKIILKNIKNFIFDKNKNNILGIKSAIVFGNLKNNTLIPVLYIRKSKYISEEDYKILLNKITIIIEK